MDYTTVLAKAAQTLEQRKDRSAWDKGVTVYALEMVEQLAEAAEGGYILQGGHRRHQARYAGGGSPLHQDDNNPQIYVCMRRATP